VLIGREAENASDDVRLKKAWFLRSPKVQTLFSNSKDRDLLTPDHFPDSFDRDLAQSEPTHCPVSDDSILMYPKSDSSMVYEAKNLSKSASTRPSLNIKIELA
jgi:hypothetical protein